jgi:hypothetical protein
VQFGVPPRPRHRAEMKMLRLYDDEGCAVPVHAGHRGSGTYLTSNSFPDPLVSTVLAGLKGGSVWRLRQPT